MKRFYKYKGPIVVNGKLATGRYSCEVVSENIHDALFLVCSDYRKNYFEKFKDDNINKAKITASAKYLQAGEITA